MSKLTKWAIIIGVGVIIWLIPVPTGVKPIAWHTLAIFIATIVGLILSPIPIGAFSLLSLCVAALLKVATMNDLLVGFSSSAVWIAVGAFLLAKGFTKTGLGRRIALLLISRYGHSTLKLGYILAVSDLFFAPATPSNTARGGGIIYPVIKGINEVFDSSPGATARKVGAYLVQVEYQVCIVTSAMFMTAMVGNPLIPVFAQKIANVEITWMSWATGAIVPGLAALLVFPYLWYKIYPPDLKETPEAPIHAKAELAKKKMSRDEKIMLAVFLGCLTLWATSQWTKLDSTHVALMGVCALVVSNVLTWKDCLDENGAWDTLVWVGALVILASVLAKHGLIAWFAKAVSASLVGISWPITLGVLIIVYLYTHYMFASLSAHITALYPALIAVAIAGGVPPVFACLVLAYFSDLCGSLTHYGAGVTPILFGSGYVDQATWWKLGFIASLVNLTLFCGVGAIWWKVLGYW
ncbi:MAG: anion transporter family protein [Firmicutes bacterium]|nr:anion transporter family protein [Bacillota bacterium]